VSVDDGGAEHGHGAAAADQQRSDARLRGLQRGTTQEAALAFYDSLEPVSVEEMIGSWRGEGLPTGHPFDGLLETLGWHGKRFDAPDGAHPLVFDANAGRRVSVNPALMPVAVLVRYPRLLHMPMAARFFSLIRPLVATRKPKARLRLTQYRGVVTATMCYDALPVNDAFRKVDDDTLVGAMDLRGLDTPFLFVLRREPSVKPGGQA
jgi:GXWXG protein/Domain of unknown function (DUF4334)